MALDIPQYIPQYMALGNQNPKLDSLKAWVRGYNPYIGPIFTGTVNGKHPCSKRELRQLVEQYSPGASDGFYTMGQGLIYGQSRTVDQKTALESIIKEFTKDLDDLFFFGLLRSKKTRDKKRLVKLEVEEASEKKNKKKEEKGRKKHGSFKQDNCSITIYEHPGKELGDYIGTLAHEMVHAYLYMFAQDRSDTNQPDASDMGNHNIEWCRLFTFIIRRLCAFMPDNPGLMAACERGDNAGNENAVAISENEKDANKNAETANDGNKNAEIVSAVKTNANENGEIETADENERGNQRTPRSTTRRDDEVTTNEEPRERR
ncbi:hypothetical protein F4778DRAFT_790059 [Xylariomycetidae sp. FL2044]|nr:hypothetical protein F4778DRAFT_790059 [Xylariomycetidae sp. FL2044]